MMVRDLWKKLVSNMGDRYDVKATTVTQLPPWLIDSGQFINDTLENYVDPHTQSMIAEVESFFTPKTAKQICIGGGFATYVAGITTEYNDIDLFCYDEETFKRASATLPPDKGEIIDRDGYGKLIKFKIEDQKYDLVYPGPLFDQSRLDPNVLDVLMTFDLNWAMAAIPLHTNDIWIHPEALSTSPRINIPEAARCPMGTQDRLKKYRSRLMRAVDEEQYAIVEAGLKRLARNPDEFDQRAQYANNTP